MNRRKVSQTWCFEKESGGIKRLPIIRLRFSVVLMLVLVTIPSIGPQKVEAYNGWYHSEMTQNVLTDQSFVPKAALLATVGNLLTDVYSTLPGIIAFFTRGPWPSEAAPFHFSNLFTREDVQNYWEKLEADTEGAIRAKAGACDCKLLLLLLGVTTHTVQDFYSHSNWIEEWSAAGYKPSEVPTWQEAQDEIKNNPDSKLARDAENIMKNIQTGAYEAPKKPPSARNHDDPDCPNDPNDGLNKDAPNSRSGQKPWPGMTDDTTLFSGSLDVAKRSTEEWKLKIKGWLDAAKPECWENLKNCDCTNTAFEKDVAHEYMEIGDLMEAAGRWTESEDWEFGLLYGAYSRWENRFPSYMNEILRKLFQKFRTDNPMNKYLTSVDNSAHFCVASGQTVESMVALPDLVTARTEEIELLTGGLPQGLEFNWDPLAGVVALSGSTSAPPGTTTVEFEGLGRRIDVLVRLSVTVDINGPDTDGDGIGDACEAPVPVGGLVEIAVSGSDSPASAAERAGSSSPPYASIAGAAAAALLAITAGAWYARRRLLR